jgi:hydrophobe/amphiphile efflux-1 (HAE1) family protein
LVLAIGIVVDDAIVVLENIERWMAMGYGVREATINAMNEITGPIIAITLVLCSVFLPVAFIGGITGQFYRQFALTIAASMVISAINAMTMTPARAASVFGHRKPGEATHHGEALPWWGVMIVFAGIGYLISGFVGGGNGEGEGGGKALQWGMVIAGAVIGLGLYKPVNAVLGKLFRAFNKVFDKGTNVYGWTVSRFVRLSAVVLLVYAGLLVLTYFGLTHVPMGFVPQQDKGYVIGNVELPDSASLERTNQVALAAEKILRGVPGVAHVVTVTGYSFIQGANSPNWASSLVVLDSFEHRHAGGDLTANGILRKARAALNSQIIEARTNLFGAPPVDGLGTAGGFKILVEDRGDVGIPELARTSDELAARGNDTPGLVGLYSALRAESPQLYVGIDRQKAKAMDVPLSEVFNALQVYLGAVYVNDFNQFGRTWQVIAQAQGQFRADAKTVAGFKVRSNSGKMVPLGTIAKIEDSYGPVLITRYNLYPASPISGASLPGVSSGDVITTMEKLADETLPSNMAYEWTELTLMQKLAGNTAVYAFIGAVVLVFLVLAAQYESWSMPAAVILVVPMCLLCAIAGVAIARMDINIFVQVGFIVLVGLAAKNAILVVEFAAEQEAKHGKSSFDAVVEAAKTRLRPIIMTSFAFILGVFPLVIGKGAGAEMRNTLGTAVFAGMLGVTFFGIFLTPVFYYVVRWFASRGKTPAAPRGEARETLERPAPAPATPAEAEHVTH